MKSCFLFGWVYLVLSLGTAYAVELSSDELGAIKLAKQEGKYPVKILENKSGEIDRTVVLVGETHRVNQVRHECAQKLVSSFDLVGIEGGLPLNQEMIEFLEFSYFLGGLYKKGAGKYSGPIELAHQRSLPEKGEEASALGFIRVAPQYASLGKTIPVTGQNEDIYNLFQKIGLRDGDLITPDSMNDVIAKVRNFLAKEKENRKRDVILLESSDRVPDKCQVWLQSELKFIQNLKSAAKIGLGWLGTFTLAKCVGSEPLVDSLLTLGGASAVCYALYELNQYFIRDTQNQAMLETRNQTMVKEILKGFSDKPQAKTMLVLCGEYHFPGILNSLLSEGFIEIDFSKIEPS